MTVMMAEFARRGWTAAVVTVWGPGDGRDGGVCRARAEDSGSDGVTVEYAGPGPRTAALTVRGSSDGRDGRVRRARAKESGGDGPGI